MIARVHHVLLVAVFVLVAVTGCATIDFDYPRSESRALAAKDQTALDAQVSAILASGDEQESGFYLLRDGMDSLGMRFQLLRRAERSIDVQVYKFVVDVTGSVWDPLAFGCRGQRRKGSGYYSMIRQRPATMRGWPGFRPTRTSRSACSIPSTEDSRAESEAG